MADTVTLYAYPTNRAELDELKDITHYNGQPVRSVEIEPPTSDQIVVRIEVYAPRLL